jgi:hypothetical protein
VTGLESYNEWLYVECLRALAATGGDRDKAIKLLALGLPPSKKDELSELECATLMVDRVLSDLGQPNRGVRQGRRPEAPKSSPMAGRSPSRV